MSFGRSGALPGSAPGTRLDAVAHRIILIHGWRRAVLAILAGALGALAMPPYGVFPALVVSLTIAVWLLDGAAMGGGGWRTLRASLGIGWAWGFGYLTAGLWWLGSAFLVEADTFAWALPLGVVGLPAVLALFYAGGFAAARLVWSRGAGRVLALAFGLSACEWLRGHLFTGFPWNTLGMALGADLWLMQAAAWIGLYGLTILAAAIAAAPATLATGTGAGGRTGPPIAAAAALAGLALFGILRLPSGPDPTVAGVRLRLVQPNIPQDAKFRPENRDGIVDRYLELSDRATSPERTGLADVTHVIWPESAFPFLLQRDPETLAKIGTVLPPGTHLVTGAARAQEPFTRAHAVFHNAILTIESGGALGDSYDKVHLVPFGEYLPAPLDAILRAVGLRQFVSVPGGFTPGAVAAQRILAVPGLPPAAASICYEAIFPGAVLPTGDVAPGAGGEAAKAPGLILNVTNDAWFGDTPGPRQHFAQARLRTVEEGLPLVRDANSGISGVVDPHGRIVASLDLGTEGVLDADLPEALPGRTVYARAGDGPFAVLLLASLLAAIALRRRPV